MWKRHTSLPPSVNKLKNCPESHGYLIILCKGSGSNHDNITRLHCSTARKTDRLKNAKLKQLLNYAATHTDAVITYQASEMVLVVHSDTLYLSKTKYRIIASVHLFMSNNWAVLTIAKIIKAVM